MKKVLLIALICSIFVLSACENYSVEKPVVDSLSTTTTTAVKRKYFESNATVNDFFVRYNETAANKIDATSIKKGNIKTKALVYTEQFDLEVINTGTDEVFVSIQTSFENEQSVLYAVFRDSIMATTSLDDSAVLNMWNKIHESGYMVSDYEANGITMTYVPSKELSWGRNDPRVDLTLTIEK